MDLVILAGGLGSRYGSEKQWDVFGSDGAWLMDYGIYDAWQAGCRRVVVVAKEERVEAIQAHLQSRWGSALEIVVATQPNLGRSKPWGTGHAALQARTWVSGAFVLINADDFYGRATYEALYNYLKGAQKDQWAMVGYRLEATLSPTGTVSRGVCTCNAQGQLLRIEEQGGLDAQSPLLNQSSLVSMNAWGASPLLFDCLAQGWEAFYKQAPVAGAEYFLPTGIMGALTKAQANVQVLQVESPWLGVTYAQDKALVVERLAQAQAQGQYPLALQAS